MAIYHLSASIIARSSGRSAVAAAAYRSGSRLEDRQLEKTHDYTPRRGIERSFIVAPENAPAWVRDREELWNRAELAEKRKDARTAREINIALPHELTEEQRAALVRRFAQDAFVKHGMVADVAIHRPDKHGDERNHHAHILLTTRELDGENFAAKKQREWDREETLERWRELWAEYQNDALEEAGSSERVDHRSYEDRGVGRVPTHHLGYQASAMERRGIPTRIGEENREAMAQNQELDMLVNELAELDAQLAEEMQQAILAEEETPAAPMTREQWEAYKRERQNLPAWRGTEEYARLNEGREALSLLGDNAALYDVDNPTRDRVTQDKPQLNIGRDEPEPER
jgi:hypothetical protein